MDTNKCNIVLNSKRKLFYGSYTEMVELFVVK